MDKYEELAADIIDRVCEVIESNYPEIKPRVITSDDSIDEPALINGTTYYDLECEIANIIKKKQKAKGRRTEKEIARIIKLLPVIKKIIGIKEI